MEKEDVKCEGVNFSMSGQHSGLYTASGEIKDGWARKSTILIFKRSARDGTYSITGKCYEPEVIERAAVALERHAEIYHYRARS